MSDFNGVKVETNLNFSFGNKKQNKRIGIMNVGGDLDVIDSTFRNLDVSIESHNGKINSKGNKFE